MKIINNGKRTLHGWKPLSSRLWGPGGCTGMHNHSDAASFGYSYSQEALGWDFPSTLSPTSLINHHHNDCRCDIQHQKATLGRTIGQKSKGHRRVKDANKMQVLWPTVSKDLKFQCILHLLEMTFNVSFVSSPQAKSYLLLLFLVSHPFPLHRALVPHSYHIRAQSPKLVPAHEAPS